MPSFSCLLAWLKRAIFKHCFVQNVLQLGLYFEGIKSRAGEAQRFLQNRITVSLALEQTEAMLSRVIDMFMWYQNIQIRLSGSKNTLFEIKQLFLPRF